MKTACRSSPRKKRSTCSLASFRCSLAEAAVLSHADRFPAKRCVLPNRFSHPGGLGQQLSLDFATLVEALDELALVACQGQDRREQVAAVGQKRSHLCFRQGARTQGRQGLALQLGGIELHVPARRGVAHPRRVLVAEDGMRERNGGDGTALIRPFGLTSR